MAPASSRRWTRIGGGHMTDWRTEDLAEVRQDALSVLEDMLNWQLSAARWEGIAGSVEALAAYLDLGDLAAARETVILLELAGPVRTTRIGAVPPQPPPRPVRERINQLIHRLSGGESQAASTKPDDGEEGTEEAGAAS
jgi:hypothetical protein